VCLGQAPTMEHEAERSAAVAWAQGLLDDKEARIAYAKNLFAERDTISTDEAIALVQKVSSYFDLKLPPVEKIKKLVFLCDKDKDGAFHDGEFQSFFKAILESVVKHVSTAVAAPADVQLQLQHMTTAQMRAELRSRNVAIAEGAGREVLEALLQAEGVVVVTRSANAFVPDVTVPPDSPPPTAANDDHHSAAEAEAQRLAAEKLEAERRAAAAEAEAAAEAAAAAKADAAEAEAERLAAERAEAERLAAEAAAVAETERLAAERAEAARLAAEAAAAAEAKRLAVEKVEAARLAAEAAAAAEAEALAELLAAEKKKPVALSPVASAVTFALTKAAAGSFADLLAQPSGNAWLPDESHAAEAPTPPPSMRPPTWLALSRCLPATADAADALFVAADAAEAGSCAMGEVEGALMSLFTRLDYVRIRIADPPALDLAFRAAALSFGTRVARGAEWWNLLQRLRARLEILEILETAGGWEPGQRVSIAEFRRAARAFESWGAHAVSGAEAAIAAFAEIDVAGSGMVPIEDVISWAVERRDRIRGGGDIVPPPPALFTPDTEALTPVYTSEETDPIHGLGFSPIGASRPSRPLPTRRSGSCCSSLRSGTTLSPSSSAPMVPAHRSLLHPTATSGRQRGSPSAELGYWNPFASDDDASPSQQPSQQQSPWRAAGAHLEIQIGELGPGLRSPHDSTAHAAWLAHEAALEHKQKLNGPAASERLHHAAIERQARQAARKVERGVALQPVQLTATLLKERLRDELRQRRDEAASHKAQASVDERPWSHAAKVKAHAEASPVYDPSYEPQWRASSPPRELPIMDGPPSSARARIECPPRVLQLAAMQSPYYRGERYPGRSPAAQKLEAAKESAAAAATRAGGSARAASAQTAATRQQAAHEASSWPHGTPSLGHAWEQRAEKDASPRTHAFGVGSQRPDLWLGADAASRGSGGSLTPSSLVMSESRRQPFAMPTLPTPGPGEYDLEGTFVPTLGAQPTCKAPTAKRPVAQQYRDPTYYGQTLLGKDLIACQCLPDTPHDRWMRQQAKEKATETMRRFAAKARAERAAAAAAAGGGVVVGATAIGATAAAGDSTPRAKAPSKVKRAHQDNPLYRVPAAALAASPMRSKQRDLAGPKASLEDWLTSDCHIAPGDAAHYAIALKELGVDAPSDLSQLEQGDFPPIVKLLHRRRILEVVHLGGAPS
jgi:hypothetical protein